MVALRSLRDTVRALAASPVVFLGGLVYALVITPQSALSLAGVPIVPNLLSVVTFFVTPFVVAGTIGLAARALDGDATFAAFTDVGRRRYLSLLLGNLIEFGITVLVGVVVLAVGLIVALVLGVGIVAGGGGSMAGALGVGGLLLLGAVGLVLAVVVAAVFFLVQFYPVAIVYDEADAVEGFTRSYRLVRDDLLATLGFSVVNLLVGLLTSVPIVALVAVRAIRRGGVGPGAPGAPPGPAAGMGPGVGPAGGVVGGLFSLPEVLALTAVSLALTTVLMAFRQTYATAFYRAAV
ncbi:MAG: hypothetical protein ABEJ81_08235 [Haloferacaceae archaeon]